MRPCAHCPALVASRTQVVPPTPCPAGGLLALGEAPGGDEDRLGEGFVGRAGKTLDALLAAHGVQRQDYGRANICRCRPPENRKPTHQEAVSCLPLLAEFLLATRPKVILTVGATPTAALMGPGSLSSWLEQSSTFGGGDQVGCHPLLRAAIAEIDPYIVPMPHTSPLAFNRKAPSGERWAEVARRQVAAAVQCLRGS